MFKFFKKEKLLHLIFKNIFVVDANLLFDFLKIKLLLLKEWVGRG